MSDESVQQASTSKAHVVAALVAPSADSVDKSSTAFAKMTKAEREKLKQMLLIYYHESYIEGLRGASSGHMGYMSQLVAEVQCVCCRYFCRDSSSSIRGSLAETVGSVAV